MPAPYTADTLRKRLAPLLARAKAQRAWVFGSHARGEADAESDVDLVVIAETEAPFVDRYKQFASAFSQVPEIEMWVFTPAEWQKMHRQQATFYRSVVRCSFSVLEASHGITALAS